MAETQAFDQTAVREWLQLAVKTSGLTPGGLAKKAGVSPTTVTRFFYGRATHLPTFRTLSKISDAAGIALTPGGSAFTMFPLERQTADNAEPSVEGAARRPREVPPDPRSGLFLSLMDLLGNVYRLQDTLLAARQAHPEVIEFSAILAAILELQNRLYALTREEGVKLTDLMHAMLLKEAKAALAADPEPETMRDQPQHSSKTAA
jgi:transcriptional regulator with XRE-family HTH domain